MRKAYFPIVLSCWYTFGTNSAAVAMLCRMLGGPSYSFTVHGPEEFDRQVGLSLTEKIEHAAFVVGISSYGRSQLLRLAPADRRDDVHVIHCGLSSSYLESESGPIGSAPTLVTVGRLSEQKGEAGHEGSGIQVGVVEGMRVALR